MGAAVTWTPGALSHDQGGRIYKGRPTEPLAELSKVYWSPKMRAAAFAVMALPVTVRDEPGARAGEIHIVPRRP